MFDHVEPPAEPSLARGVKWPYLSLFVLLTFACFAVAFSVTRYDAGSALTAEASAHPGTPSTPSEGKAETEVVIGTEVEIGAWRVVFDHTHDVKDAGNAGLVPDQRDAVIFPGGELALAYSTGEYIAGGSGNALRVYGTAGDTTPYTVFVKGDAADRWNHLDANRHGFPRGAGSHGIRQPRVAQIKIRNDGTTNLFVDAIGVLRQPDAAATSRAATSRPERAAQAAAAVPAPEAGKPASAEASADRPTFAEAPAGKPVSFREPVAANPAVSASAEADRTPPTPSPAFAEASAGKPVHAGVVQPGVESPVPVENKTEPQAYLPPAPGGAQPRRTLELPQRMRRVPPQYPKIAQMANVAGTVVIEAVIDVDGRVKSPRIVKSIPLLNTAALDAVNQWEFKPAMRDGRPVPVTAQLSVEFVP